MAIIGDAFVQVRPETSEFAGEIESQFQSIFSALTSPVALIAGATIGAGLGLVALGDHFEEAFSSIQRQTGATGPALDGLEQSFKNVYSTAIGGTFDNVSNSLSVLHDRTGLTGASLDDLTRKEVELGTITKTDVGANVNATTALFGQFGVAAANMSHELDVLFKASQDSGTSVDQLESTMTSITPIAQALGLTFDQTAALTDNLTRLGLPATKVMMGLGTEFAKAAKAGKDPISVIQDLITQIKAAPDPTTAATIATSKFGIGARQAAALVDGLRSGALNLGDTLAKISSPGGGIDATAQSTATLGEKFDLLKQKALVALEPIAMKAVDVANALIDGIIPAMGYIGDAFSYVGGIISDFWAGFQAGATGASTGGSKIEEFGAKAYYWFTIVKNAGAHLLDDVKEQVGQFVDFYGPRLLNIWQGVVNLWNNTVYPALHDKLLPVLKDIGTWLEQHWKPVLLAVGIAFGLMVAPITTVALGLAVLYEKSALFRDVVDTTAAFLRDNWRPILEGIGIAMLGLVGVFIVAYERFDGFRHLVNDALSNLRSTVSDFVDYFSARWDKIRVAVENVFTALKIMFAVVLAPLFLLWSNFHDQIMAVVTFVWGTIVDIVQNAVRVIGDLFDFIISILSGKWGDAWNDVLDIFATAYDAIKDQITRMGQFFLDFFSTLPENIITTLGDLAGLLLPAATDLIGGLLSGITTAFVAVTTWFVNLPVVLAGFFIGAAVWLVESGVQVLEGLSGGIAEGFVAITTFFDSLPEKFAGFFASATTWLINAGKDVLNGLIYGVQVGINSLAGWFYGLPGTILSWIPDLGKLLLNVGKSIIQGLIDGIGSMFDAVKNKLGDLTHDLTSWKGPPGVDAVLLHGSGQLIIQGFLAGLESQYDSVRQSLGAFTNGLGSNVSLGGTVGGLTGPASALAFPSSAAAPASTTSSAQMLALLQELVDQGRAGQALTVHVPPRAADPQHEALTAVVSLRDKQIAVGR